MIVKNEDIHGLDRVEKENNTESLESAKNKTQKGQMRRERRDGEREER